MSAAAEPDWGDEEEREAGRARAAEGPRGEDDLYLYPDPEDTCSRPADLDNAELEEMAAQADAEGVAEAARIARTISAGFGMGYAHVAGAAPLPGSHHGPAAGFAQGMPLDDAAPSLGLAGAAGAAAGQDHQFTAVNDDELLGLLSAQNRLEARHAWESLMTVAEFIRRRPAPGSTLEGADRMPSCWSEHAASELSIHLHVAGGNADALLSLAWSLVVKLPLTSAALRDGTIGLDKAETIASYCSVLTPEEARAAEAMVIPDAARLTFRALQDRIKAAVIEVNAEAATRRREEAAKTRRVEVKGEDSGNASIAGRELPSAAVLAANANLTARARQLKAHFRAQGIKAGMDELRAIAFMEAFNVTIDPLDGRDDTDTADTDTVGRHSTGHDAPAGHGDDDATRDDAPAGQADPSADDTDRADGKDGTDGTDGDADGTDGGSGNGGRGPAGPRPAGSGGTGATSPLPAGIPAGFAGRTNLTIPMPTLLGLAEKAGTASRIGITDPDLTRDLAAAAARNPASTWCVTVTGDDGRPVAHGCARPAKTTKTAKTTGTRPPPGPGTRDGAAFRPDDDHGPPGDSHGPPDPYGTWRLNPAALTGNPGGQEMIITLEPLDGPCDHKYQAAGHDPGVKLRHLTGVLNASCTFPPCRRPEAQSDYEHSRPHGQGGITCLCEGGPVCRHNHRDKQQPGWRLREAGSRGWFRWTTPSGRTYLSGPTQYPA
jgi:hypothetical protein